jgi:PST family polysaccharide transporter
LEKDFKEGLRMSEPAGTPVVIKGIAKYWRGDLAQNAIALYGVHIASYILPLLSLPYLAHVLGPSGWGLVALVQSLGQYLCILAEYGFDLSATRDTARYRNDRVRLAEVVSGVLGAKALLALVTVVLAFVIVKWSPALKAHNELLWIAILLAVAPGLNCMWYFQGLERMRIVAGVDVATRILGTAGVFVVVRHAGDGWKYLLLQGGLATVSTGVMGVLICRELQVQIPSWSAAWETLRAGWNMFLFRSFSGLFTSANVFLLGFFVPPQIVGYFAGAEKITRASYNILWPLTRALYPRISHLAVHETRRASNIVRVSLGFMVLAGGFVGVTLFAGASVLVRVLLGKDFAPASSVLRIFAILPPVIAINTVLCIQWLMPLGRDRWITRIVLGSGVFNVALCFVLVPRFGAPGMAWSVTLAELATMFGLIWVIRRDPLLSFSSTRTGEASTPIDAPAIVLMED